MNKKKSGGGRRYLFSFTLCQKDSNKILLCCGETGTCVLRIIWGEGVPWGGGRIFLCLPNRGWGGGLLHWTFESCLKIASNAEKPHCPIWGEDVFGMRWRPPRRWMVVWWFTLACKTVLFRTVGGVKWTRCWCMVVAMLVPLNCVYNGDVTEGAGKLYPLLPQKFAIGPVFSQLKPKWVK